jgi:hypothetical protein
MSTVDSEILELEERLRQAELGPDPQFFQDVLADNAVLMSDGEPAFAKAWVKTGDRWQIVAASIAS